LFNKDSILEWLLEPDAFGDGAQVLKVGSVAGLKDVVDVKFEIAGSASKSSSSAERNGNASSNSNNGAVNNGKDTRAESWVCPVSRKELGPGSKAVYLVPCGHAFAQAVISEIKEDRCLVCSEPFEASNVIPINPTQKSDLDRLKTRIEKLSAEGLSHSLKKASSKKRKKDKEKKHAPAENNGTKEASNGATVAAGKAGETSSKSSIANAATASITSRVLAEQESSKRRKVESDNVKSLFTSSTVSKDANGASAKHSANRDFMSRGYTMPSKSK
jgi:hypothetical protein